MKLHVGQLLQKLGINRYSRLGWKFFGLTEKLLGYYPNYSGEFPQSEASKSDDWDPDAQHYRDFYADFLRYYFAYTPSLKQRGLISIIDIGCGLYFYPLLRRYLGGNAELVYRGVDPNIKKDDLKDYQERVLFTRGVGEDLHYADGAFNIALALSVLDHVNDPRKTLREAKRVLSHDGCLWITSTVFRDRREIDKEYRSYHNHVFTKKELVELVKQVFLNIRVFEGLQSMRQIYILAKKN